MVPFSDGDSEAVYITTNFVLLAIFMKWFACYACTVVLVWMMRDFVFADHAELFSIVKGDTKDANMSMGGFSLSLRHSVAFLTYILHWKGFSPIADV